MVETARGAADLSPVEGLEGNGPVHALDAALRQALVSYLPWLDEVQVTDHQSAS